MEIEKPLPPIWALRDFTSAEHELKIANNKHVARYGYILLALTWTLFIVTVNTLFKCWLWVIHPLKLHEETLELYVSIKRWCERIDYVVTSLWCVYVIAWWWALFSWVGIKLFRHSKGIQI
ncbi:hypothetical protein METBIDRAFT_224735 [Metschnikowia bicuspidata var. bicuspidata NRRL YB-4993]|uniref:Uncharacterized protein n=1 Tax=Metschnikowia bicuspidata var. bicuspidata NRRL YB-4993 TaxID=869754 RepID=A0A1A0H519_9ASCO|nr:hypothetical protein METBIDRAFT_224735 [Metschnikowia bicuspidata var. bicuspidata NRRL YB-4993]OBA19045.1 hypothetical protein METBIDRAFT_224735 [Metschnikowia bicuspidata var. bicuspidata NRRL YB-4993]